MDDRTDRVISRTAIFANAALVLALGVTAIVIAWPRVASAIGIKRAAPAAAYRTGDHIDVPKDWYQSSNYTLVLFARSSCSACQAAHPFLQKLVAGLKGKAAVAMASTELERDDDLRYGRSLGIDDDANRVTPGGLRVRATPTLVLVKRDGTVLGAWEGVGPPERQTQIEHAIASAMQ
jgi:thiol-disulfide isomerase/thioredoxin